MTEHEIKIAFKEYDAVEELNNIDHNLCREAVKALATSHSPYSKFRVGLHYCLKAVKYCTPAIRKMWPIHPGFVPNGLPCSIGGLAMPMTLLLPWL
jgi:hypothetical protein